MMGVNINCRYQDFVGEILSGKKIMETRNSDSLRPYVGKRVGIVRTGCGKAKLEGFATILAKVEFNNEADFRAMESIHLVHKGSKYDFRDKKYGYILTDIERCEPRECHSFGIVAREVI